MGKEIDNYKARKARIEQARTNPNYETCVREQDRKDRNLNLTTYLDNVGNSMKGERASKNFRPDPVKVFKVGIETSKVIADTFPTEQKLAEYDRSVADCVGRKDRAQDSRLRGHDCIHEPARPSQIYSFKSKNYNKSSNPITGGMILPDIKWNKNEKK